MLRAKIIFCPYEAGYFYGVYNENSDFIRTPELFLRLKKREFCFKPYQRVVHVGAAMRRSIPLRGLSLSGFAIWEYLPKNCFASKLARSFSANIPAWLNFRTFFKNPLAFSRNTGYNTSCCDMIAVKREVAAARQVFPWSECQEAGTLPGRET